MVPKHSFLALTAVLLTSSALHAASTANLEQEYQQVRKIALRDPKVRAAYEEADRKLQAKIVQIDPALANFQPFRTSGPESTAAPAKPATHPKPVAAPEGTQATHTVVKGDTLGGIASHYGVTVAALKAANHIADEKKLGVGQVLSIPAASVSKKAD
jgi:LysM repeat protein